MACVVTKYVSLSSSVVKPGETFTVNMRFGDNCPVPQLFSAYCYLDGDKVWHDWGFILPYTEEHASCKVVAPTTPGQHYINVKTNQEQDDGLPGKTIAFVVSSTKPSNKGLLIVQTEPAGASIYINGKFAGYSPVSAWVPQGWYDVVAKMKGYKDAEKHVYVMVNKVTRVTFELQKISTPSITPSALAAMAGIAMGVGVAYVIGEERIKKGVSYAKKGAAYARSKAVSAYSKVRELSSKR